MKPDRTLLAAAALLLLACAHPAAAQGKQAEPAQTADDDTIQTDRPGIADGSTVIGPGRFQAEVGVQREYRGGAHSDERTLYIPTLLRFGIDKRWEARIETNGYSRDRSFAAGAGVSHAEGYSPISLGAKWQFQDANNDTRKPSLGIIGRVFVPSGSSDFRSKRLTTDLRLAADHQLSEKWSLNWNVGMALYEDDGGDTFGAGLAAATISYAVNKRLTAFFDAGLQGPERRQGGVALIVDGGAMYLLNKDTQIDFGIGPGVTGKTVPDLFWTAGVSHRF